jgi:hypothetical protein
VAVADAVESIKSSIFAGQDASSTADSVAAAVRAARPLAAGPCARVVLAAAVEGPRDPELADVVRAKLHDLRAKTRAVIGDASAGGGLGTLLAAALDGLLLHAVIDPETDLDGAADALALLLGGGAGRS